MYSNIILPRGWPRFSCICRTLTTLEGQKVPQSSKSSDGISPPPRIHRSPTDILQALSATVGPDPTAAHFKYHDDPYLIPLSNFRKRSYALSAEAGRKAAAWVRDEHAVWFTTREWDPPGKMKTPYFNADPVIDAFAPKPIYNDESKVTEEDFKYTISNALLDDSIKVFQLLGGTDAINNELKLKFLQLLCFCNEKEPESLEWLEERWFAANTRERQVATWKVGGLAEKIFESLDPKMPEAYCALILGMAKHYQAERAHMLTQEAIEKGIPLSTNVFNALLGCIGFLKEGTVLRMEELKKLLSQMAELGLTPNDGTLTACLRSVSAWGGGKVLQDLALQIVTEFRNIGIEPGLSAYYHLLCLFCKERGPRIDVLSDILKNLEKREKLIPEAPTDTSFFITAMGVCSEHLQDFKMAERLHALLMKGDNYKLVGDAYKESIYYRHFITVACRHAPFETTTQLLDSLVPNVYVPEPSVMEEIIKTLEIAGSGDRLAHAWSQLVVFGIAKRVKLVERLLSAMCSCYEYQDDVVKTNMRAAACDILKYSQPPPIEDGAPKSSDRGALRSPMPKLSANAMTDIVQLCSDVKDKTAPEWEVVFESLQKLRKSEAAGVPSNPQTLVNVALKATAFGKHGVAAAAVQYLAENGFEEAITASIQTLGAMLNRPPEDIEQMLQQKVAHLDQSLHPSAFAVVEAYQLAKTGVASDSLQSADSSTSSESDSDMSSDDE